METKKKKWSPDEERMLYTLVSRDGIAEGLKTFGYYFPERTLKAAELRWYKIKDSAIEPYDFDVLKEVEKEEPEKSIWKKIIGWLKSLFK